MENWGVSEIRAMANLAEVDLTECHNRQEMVRALQTAVEQRPPLGNYLAALAPLAQLSIAQLRAVARERQIVVTDCLEKSDLIQKLVRQTPHSPSVW